MNINETQGGGKGLCTCAQAQCIMGVRGHAPPGKNLVFRLSETASGAFSGTVSLVFIKRFWEKLFSTDVVETGIERLIVAILKGGGKI